MNQPTARELLYLEDTGKLFESIAKTCDFAAEGAVDPQFKSYLQSLSKEHKEWLMATAGLGKGTPVQ